MPTILVLAEIPENRNSGAKTTLEDGSVMKPEPLNAVDVHLDNGTILQIERPLTVVKIQAALATKTLPIVTIDGISEGDIV